MAIIYKTPYDYDDAMMYPFNILSEDAKQTAIVMMWENDLFLPEEYAEPEDIPMDVVLDAVKHWDLLFTEGGTWFYREDCVKYHVEDVEVTHG